MNYWKQALSDWNHLFREELLGVFKDQGVLIFCLLVPLGYPLLYAFIYTNEVLHELPVAVVDDCRSTQSREFLRHLDATSDVRITAYCADMAEAQELVKRREAYGAVCVPRDFSRRLARGEQVAVSAYSDLGGMLYYKAVLTAATNASLDLNAQIKVKRAGGTTAEQDQVAEHPITYQEVSVFNPQNGFATFLIPAVLVLIIQQTLLLGVGMAAGTAREQNRFRSLVPFGRQRRGMLRIVWAKSLAYLLVYIPISVYVLGVVPHLFQLSQLGRPADMGLFMLPYVVACIFFAMTVSALVRNREMCILLIVFTSVPLLFISGLSWPSSAVSAVWKTIGYIFPSTFGIKGFVAINNMGAPLGDLRQEWTMLWIQAAVYCLTTCVVYRASILHSRQRLWQAWQAARLRRRQTRSLPTEQV